MYTVSKGPSKFVAKARMGIPSHTENSSWEIKKSLLVYNDDFSNVVSDSNKPVFVQLNNKKLNSLRSHETITPEHEEIVKFVSENWSSVTCKSKEGSSMKNGTSTVYYQANEPNSQLKDFVPFDLDSWWGKRLFNTITKSVP
ncbi:MAPK regulated corepressor interacting protein 2 [Planococcus citri]|uniref:MAPK regulated corepressor interacting protein 2 n=1 Tax=Planococcus citri TaxID=170843 RepID=UPI0031F8E8B4